jgi:hypothetical protein
MFHDAEAEARATGFARAALFYPVKALKNMEEIFAGNARAVIMDKAFDFVRFDEAGANFYLRTSGGVFERIFNQIAEDLRELFLVSTDGA